MCARDPHARLASIDILSRSVRAVPPTGVFSIMSLIRF
jgi:hypothetical protein